MGSTGSVWTPLSSVVVLTCCHVSYTGSSQSISSGVSPRLLSGAFSPLVTITPLFQSGVS